MRSSCPLLSLFLAFVTPCAAGGLGGYYTAPGAAPGWANLLRSIGLPQRAAGDASVAVVADAEWLVRAEAGAILVIEGDSPIGHALGFEAQTRKVKVRRVQDAGRPDLRIVWEDSASTPVFTVPKDAKVYCRAHRSNAPLLAGVRRGRGAVLWAALDPGEQGFERFPFLPQALTDLGLRLPFSSRRLWAFFDYGYRYAADPGALAPRWRASGISALHVGAWQFFDRDPDQDDYLRRLIAACHRHGILVYAWLEPPHISDEFWKRHPEWREKTALLKDAYVPWRRLMNLADPACERAALDGVRKMVELFDWDGVNLAELYFDGIEGAKNPPEFTPMNDLVRRDFKSLHGFDPIELFRGGRTQAKLRTFLDYRAALAARLQERWMEALDKLRRERPGLDLTLTYVDDRFDTSMRDAIGADAAVALKLLDRYPATYIVEDPATVWHLGPDRYKEIARRYRPLTPHWERMGVDINVVERYGDVHPTLKQSGAELFELIRASAESFPHVMFYFEFSILPDDLPFLPAASAIVDKLEEKESAIEIESPYGVGVRWEGPALVDGLPWPVRDRERVWLPAGKHTVATSTVGGGPLLLDFNGQLEAAAAIPGGIALRYTSDARALAVFDRKPSRIVIDGRPAAPELVGESESAWTVRLPAGRHRTEVEFP
jgi:hypothetical protein